MGITRGIEEASCGRRDPNRPKALERKDPERRDRPRYTEIGAGPVLAIPRRPLSPDGVVKRSRAQTFLELEFFPEGMQSRANVDPMLKRRRLSGCDRTPRLE